MHRIATLFFLLLVAFSALAKGRAVRSVTDDWMPPACTQTDLPFLRFIEPDGTFHGSKGDPSVTHRPAPAMVALAIGAPANVLWAADEAGTVFRSADAGCTWSVVAAVPETLGTLSPMGIAARNAERVYVYMIGRAQPQMWWIVRITGATIEKLQIPDSQGFLELDVDPADSLHVRAIGRMARSWESRDGGATWTSHGQIVPFLAEVRDVAFDPRNFDRIVAATTAGLWVSQDGGQTWTAAVEHRSFNAVAFAASDPRVIYAGLEPRGLLRSTDGGQTFADVDTSVFRFMGVHPRNTQTWASQGAPFGVQITTRSTTIPPKRYELVGPVVWAPSGFLYYLQGLAPRG